LTESMIHNPYFRKDVDASRRILLELLNAKGGAETPV
jgi:hypothetical protein